MSKFFLLLLMAGVAALIFGGVLDVSVNPDRLGELPGTLMDTVGDRGVLEQGRVKITNAKRSGEQWLVKDVEQRLELALGYVDTDVERLDKLTEKHTDTPDMIIPQAELLIKSIDRIGDLLVDAPTDMVLAAREDTNTALADARGSLTRLQELQEGDERLTNEFAQVTSVLEWHIGELDHGGDGIQQSAVAGAQDSDEEGASATAEPEETIPLDF